MTRCARVRVGVCAVCVRACCGLPACLREYEYGVGVCASDGEPFCGSQIVLETEASNAPALALYESLGFVRDKCLVMYYLNGGDAFRCGPRTHRACGGRHVDCARTAG